jgi:tetratricopeptide (TPR) repeat protein
LKNWFSFFCTGGAKDNSPRRQPQVEAGEIESPGRGGRVIHSLAFCRPIRGLSRLCPENHGFSVGYYRSLLRSCKWILASLVTLTFVGNLFASYIASDFATANRFYAQGKFPEAAKAYETILQTSPSSPSLLFNAGNAEFKSGHLGKAIAAYRQAEQLSPRDAELRANLAFVRNQVQGVTLRESRWQIWVSKLTLNEGTVLAAILFWLTCTLFIARQLRPALVPRLKTATWILAALTIFSGTVLGLQAANHFSGASAVVVADNVTARSGPFDDAQSAFTARDGAELSVLTRRDDWVQVADGTGKIGWLPMKQVEVLPGA